jgi:hypothetical protein
MPAPRTAGSDRLRTSATSKGKYDCKVGGDGSSIGVGDPIATGRRITRAACTIRRDDGTAPAARLIRGMGVVLHARKEMRAAAHSHGVKGQQQFPSTAQTDGGMDAANRFREQRHSSSIW